MQILIVEDEAELRSELVESLQLLGHDTISAGDFDAACRALKASPVPTRVLTDLQLPGRSGFELLRHIRSEPCLSARVPRMALMTGQVDITEQVAAALARNHIPILHKPFALKAALAALGHGGAQ